MQKLRACELPPVRMPVLPCRSADIMKQQQIMKPRKQSKSSTFFSFHTSKEIKRSNLKSLKKPLFITVQCFSQLNFTELSLRMTRTSVSGLENIFSSQSLSVPSFHHSWHSEPGSSLQWAPRFSVTSLMK